MPVRKATAADLPHYLELGKKFHAASPMHNVVPFDEDGYSKFYLQSVDSSTVSMWVAEADGAVVGIVGAILYSLYFSPSNLVVQELWWWLNPEHRGSGLGKEMFTTIEEWAADNGAAALFMIALEDKNAEKMEKVYARAGFRPMERTFIKQVQTWQ